MTGSVACWLAMSSDAVRMRLPAGAAFDSAFTVAAQKYAARRGFTERRQGEFITLFSAALAAARTAQPQMIEFVFDESSEGAAIVTVTGVDATSSIDRDTCDLAAASPEHAVAVELATVQFRVPLH